MTLHYLNLDGVELKTDVENKLAKDGPLAHPIGRFFPTARTNIIQIEDDLITASLDLIEHLEDRNYCINHISYNATSLREEYKKTPAFYTNLHNKVASFIRSKLGLNPDDRPNYTLWNSGKDNYHAFYIDSRDAGGSSELAKRSIKKMRRQSTEESSNNPQRVYKALLELAIKIHLAEHLKSGLPSPAGNQNSIAKQLVTNNDVCFLVKFEETKEENRYHLLKPDVLVTYKNEVVIELRYQKYKSSFLDPDSSVTEEVDVFIPKSSPWHKDDKERNQLEYDIVDSNKYFEKVPATSGEQKIKFIDTYNLGSSKLFYYSVLMSVVVNDIIKPTGTNFMELEFAPHARWRGFGKVDFENAQDDEKPELWLVNAIPDWILEKTEDIKINFKPKTKKNKGKTDPFKVKLKAKTIVDTYIDSLKQLLSEDYKVCLYRAKDLTLEGIKKGVRVVVLQSPKFKTYGYPYIKDFKTIETIKELLPDVDLMYDLDSVSGFNISDKDKKNAKNYSIPRDTNFLNIRHQKTKVESESGSDIFTDFYTALKIMALDDFSHRTFEDSAHEGMYVTQGFHIPAYWKIVNFLMADELVPKSLLLEKDKLGFELSGVKEDPLDSNALNKAKIDLELKQMLSDKTSFRLIDNEGEKIDLSVLSGQYCGYYILNPRNSTGIASRLEFEITSDGYINQISSSIVEDINQIRYDDTFPVNEKSVEKLYNDAFYLVDNDMNVLTSYSNLREPQVLDSVADTGWVKGMNIADVYYYAIDEQDKRLFSKGKISDKVYLNRGNALQKVNGSTDKYFNHENHANLTINFFTLLSQKTGTFKSEGRAIGGREWIYFSEADEDSLLMYLSDKGPASDNKSKNNRVYRLIVRGHDGSHIPVVDHPLAILYIMTANFGINRYNNPSVTSLLHTLTKMILKN